MTTASTDLNAERRRRELQQAADDVADVLVVGGGITGVGVALDAAARGLSVALIEAHDLAFGTSRFSSKLVHGGLRYLATGDVATARESAHERHLLMTTIAPHLIRPLGQLLPVSASAARRLAPALNPHGLRGGMLSYDGQLADDAKLVVTVARTAAGLGARILTRVRAAELRGDGASVEDTITGERFELRARSVVNATGVWAGGLDAAITVRPSRGTHIVLDARDLGDPTAALTIPHEGSISRYVFALPQQGGRVIVGLTDEDAPGAIPDVAEPSESEIAFLLASLNRAVEVPIRRNQVRGAFAGLRPLVDSGSTSSADVSRRHLVTTADAGFVTVLGGKLTTYRRMAEDAVDRALSVRDIAAPASRTATLTLVRDQEITGDSGAAGISQGRIEFAVRSEGALTADDVLDRRTRIGLVAADRERARTTVETIVAQTLADLG